MENFNRIKEIDNELEQIAAIYDIFDEETRLNRSNSASVEFLTTVSYIERYLRPGSRILDVGAGTGAYSLYFAAKGYEVCALELAENNILKFRERITGEMNIELSQGNAVDLSRYADESFDIVLLFGPLYHLHDEADRLRCIAEAKRVCKTDGMMFFAFIANDMVILTEMSYNPSFFLEDSYDHDTFRLKDFPFVFATVDRCRCMMADSGINVVHEVASDGVSELMDEQINRLDAESFAQYLRFHLYSCEKPEMLGHSNHLLYAGRKQQACS